MQDLVWCSDPQRRSPENDSRSKIPSGHPGRQARQPGKPRRAGHIVGEFTRMAHADIDIERIRRLVANRLVGDFVKRLELQNYQRCSRAQFHQGHRAHAGRDHRRMSPDPECRHTPLT